ncbi:MAG TPA: nucleotide exchange factor GrpE [bacterium]|nr:nucleotide exchange factor GrpE [bacterium]
MTADEKNGGNDKNEADVHEEFGKKIEEPAGGQVSNQSDLDIDDIPSPGSLIEAETELNYLRNVLKNMKKEYDDLNSNYLKSLADAENFRKRMNRDKEESLKYSNESLLRDLLPVLDFLDLAIEHSAPYVKQDTSGNLKSFVDGVKLAYNEFIKVLKNFGIETVDTTSKDFDPNFHQIVEMVGDSDQPDGKIIKEKRKGYIYKERLIRPSLVSISKPDGGKKD